MLQKHTQTAVCDVSMAARDNIATQSVTTMTLTLHSTRADTVVEDTMQTGRTADRACIDSTLVCLLNNVHPVNTHALHTPHSYITGQCSNVNHPSVRLHLKSAFWKTLSVTLTFELMTLKISQLQFTLNNLECYSYTSRYSTNNVNAALQLMIMNIKARVLHQLFRITNTIIIDAQKYATVHLKELFVIGPVMTLSVMQYGRDQLLRMMLFNKWCHFVQHSLQLPHPCLWTTLTAIQHTASFNHTLGEGLATA